MVSIANVLSLHPTTSCPPAMQARLLCSQRMAAGLTEESGVSLEVRLRQQFGDDRRGELPDERPQMLGLGVVGLRAGDHREQHTLTHGTVCDADVVGAGVIATAGLVGGAP